MTTTRAQLRMTVLASTVAITGVLPVFLLGALAVLMRDDLGLSESQLGIAVAAFFGAAAISSVPTGGLVERFGDARSLRAATLICAGMLGTLALAPTWPVLVLCVVGAGCANSFSQLASNLALTVRVSQRRQGLAFGVKQAAIPTATLLGGLAVPTIAVTLGWRAVFATAAAVAATTAIVLQRWPEDDRHLEGQRAGGAPLVRGPLVALGAAGAFGSAAAGSMASFIVSYAVDIGMDTTLAGFVLAIGSVAAIASRIVLGWLADQRTDSSLTTIGVMFLLGSVAMGAIPHVSSWLALAGVTTCAYGVGWGWPGLFHLSIARGNPRSPAAASAVSQVGLSIGGVTGPLIFGVLVEHHGYPAAWSAMALLLLTGAGLMFLGASYARSTWTMAAETSHAPGGHARAIRPR